MELSACYDEILVLGQKKRIRTLATIRYIANLFTLKSNICREFSL